MGTEKSRQILETSNQIIKLLTNHKFNTYFLASEKTSILIFYSIPANYYQSISLKIHQSNFQSALHRETTRIKENQRMITGTTATIDDGIRRRIKDLGSRMSLDQGRREDQRWISTLRTWTSGFRHLQPVRYNRGGRIGWQEISGLQSSQTRRWCVISALAVMVRG